MVLFDGLQMSQFIKTILPSDGLWPHQGHMGRYANNHDLYCLPSDC